MAGKFMSLTLPRQHGLSTAKSKYDKDFRTDLLCRSSASLGSA